MLSLESYTEIWSGRLEKARKLTRQAVASSERFYGEREPAALWRANGALREALLGNSVDARRIASIANQVPEVSRDTRARAALVFALTGDIAHAKSLADSLAENFPADTMVRSVWVPTIGAQIEIVRGNPDRSIELLREAAPYELGMLSSNSVNSCMYPTFVRGLAYLNAQEGLVAAAEFQKILNHQGLLWNCLTGPLARLGLARAYVIQGDTAKAKAAYQDFLTLWKDGDADIPVLKRARAEYAKLQ